MLVVYISRDDVIVCSADNEHAMRKTFFSKECERRASDYGRMATWDNGAVVIRNGLPIVFAEEVKL